MKTAETLLQENCEQIASMIWNNMMGIGLGLDQQLEWIKKKLEANLGDESSDTRHQDVEPHPAFQNRYKGPIFDDMN